MRALARMLLDNALACDATAHFCLDQLRPQAAPPAARRGTIC
jgi:hypothetical protein